MVDRVRRELQFKRFWRPAWIWLRQVSGDAAYENYLRCAAPGDTRVLSRSEFYLDSLRRRYSSVSRCC